MAKNRTKSNNKVKERVKSLKIKQKKMNNLIQVNKKKKNFCRTFS